MMKRDPGRKLAFEKSQIKSIVADFKKTKNKCIALSGELEEQMPNREKYDALEKQVNLKLELLDVPGLILLKKSLLKELSQLFDLEAEMSTNKERITVRKQLGGFFTHNNIPNMSEAKKVSMNQSMREIDLSKINQSPQPSRRIINAKEHLDIPVYSLGQHTSEDKVEKISKYVASLKSMFMGIAESMKDTSQQKVSEAMQQILPDDPEFCRLRQEVEKFKMREEQFESLVQKRVDRAVSQFIQELEIVEETKDYKIVKVPKRAPFERIHGTEAVEERKTEANAHNRFVLKLKNSSPDEAPPKDDDILAIEQELARDECNFSELASRINEMMQSTEKRLKELKQQRKKIYEEDEIWVELEPA